MTDLFTEMTDHYVALYDDRGEQDHHLSMEDYLALHHCIYRKRFGYALSHENYPCGYYDTDTRQVFLAG